MHEAVSRLHSVVTTDTEALTVGFEHFLSFVLPLMTSTEWPVVYISSNIALDREKEVELVPGTT